MSIVAKLYFQIGNQIDPMSAELEFQSMTASRYSFELFYKKIGTIANLVTKEIRVSLVEPGFTRTGLGANGKTTDMTLSAYAAQREQALTFIQRQIHNGADPRPVAKAVHHALTARSPRLHYRVGRPVKLAIALKGLLPEAAFYRLVRIVFQIRDAGHSPTQSLAIGSEH
jgi:NAD(P)-dependent dehydrogenase (short-subunit alcohol dehydrogenase family)